MKNMKILNIITSRWDKTINRNITRILLGCRNGIKAGGINSYLDCRYVSGMPGSGAGKGGGAGGSVRESGGSLGEFGAMQEESYFFKKQKEQLEKIKKKLDSGESLDLKQTKDDK